MLRVTFVIPGWTDIKENIKVIPREGEIFCLAALDGGAKYFEVEVVEHRIFPRRQEIIVYAREEEK